MHNVSLPERFWARVDQTGGPNACWPWTAKSKHRFGYGQLWIRKPSDLEILGLLADKPVLRGAHIVAWVLTHGPIPVETPCVLHGCDNPRCCNPTPGRHLFLGTHADNVADKEAKGRGFHGALAKLTTADVIEIRRLSSTGLNQPQIAEMFGLHRGHVGRIVRGQVWKHLN